MRPTLGKEPAAEDANPVGYLSGDTGIGLATFSYKLCVTPCLQTLRRLTIICLICPAAPLNYAPPLPAAPARAAIGTRIILESYWAMRAITIMATAAGALAAAFVFAPSANAERICRQACDQAGFCQSICVDDDHVFLDSSDKDFYLRHGRPDAFLDR